MAEVVEETLNQLNSDTSLIDATMTLDNVAQVDHLARQTAQAVIKKRAG
jgi:1-deoxy-D-xylulose-5-phosphate reductoisomerase